jgi:hypothetical protein
MKLARYAIAGLASLGLGVSACTTVTENSAPAQSSAPASPSHSSPGASTTPQSGPSPQASPPPSSGTSPNVTDPWAVVSAYYGDIESGSYAQAWALLSSGAVTGQTYQQFVDGFACTGAQQLTDQGESGNQVSFSLAATDSCTGAVQHFSGTDTVSGGRIVAAHIIQTG